MPSTKVVETENLIVIKDIYPKASIHYLIIPKKHVPDIQSLAAEDVTLAGDMIMVAQQLSRDVSGADSFRLIINNGVSAGQRVFHLHMHFLAAKKCRLFNSFYCPEGHEYIEIPVVRLIEPFKVASIKMRNLLKKCSIGFLMILGFSIVLSNYMLNKFVEPPRYSSKRLGEHESNRNRLLNEFNARQVTLVTDDNITLSGLLILREGAKRNIIICHGYRMAKERLINFASMVHNDNLLFFDFRAHGQSEGTCVTFGFNEKMDVAAAVAFLKQHEKIKDLPIIGIGVSMGAVSLLAAACQNNDFKGLVLDSAFACFDEQMRRVLKNRYGLPRFPFELIGSVMIKYRMNFWPQQINTLSWVQKIEIPMLIIHSKYDDTASWIDAQKIFQQAKGKKELWLVDTSGHARIFDDCCEEYQQRLTAFFNSILV